MSKSLKNFITVKEALRDFSARQLRLLFCLQPWAAPMTFNQQSRAEMMQKEAALRNFFLNVQARRFVPDELHTLPPPCMRAGPFSIALEMSAAARRGHASLPSWRPCLVVCSVLWYRGGACGSCMIHRPSPRSAGGAATRLKVRACPPALQLEARRNRLESSTTAPHAVHRDLAAAIEACRAAVHNALLDSIDTATAMEELLRASTFRCDAHKGLRCLWPRRATWRHSCALAAKCN